MKTKEITLSELLSTDFIIVDNKMLGTFTLDRINMISDVLKQQKEEITRLNNNINKAIKYIKNNNLYEETRLDYDIDDEPFYWDCDDDKAKNDLLSILRGEE